MTNLHPNWCGNKCQKALEYREVKLSILVSFREMVLIKCLANRDNSQLRVETAAGVEGEAETNIFSLLGPLGHCKADPGCGFLRPLCLQGFGSPAWTCRTSPGLLHLHWRSLAPRTPSHFTSPSCTDSRGVNTIPMISISIYIMVVQASCRSLINLELSIGAFSM